MSEKHLFSKATFLDDLRSVAVVELGTGAVVIQGFNGNYEKGTIQQLVFSPEAIEALRDMFVDYVATVRGRGICPDCFNHLSECMRPGVLECGNFSPVRSEKNKIIDN